MMKLFGSKSIGEMGSGEFSARGEKLRA